MPETPKRGRPPSAISKTGSREKTSTWPKIAVNIRPETKAYLDAACALLRRSGWMVIEDGIRLYIEQLPKADRSLVESIVRRTMQQ